MWMPCLTVRPVARASPVHRANGNAAASGPKTLARCLACVVDDIMILGLGKCELILQADFREMFAPWPFFSTGCVEVWACVGVCVCVTSSLYQTRPPPIQRSTVNDGSLIMSLPIFVVH
jgi:hypothetical protein